MFKIPVLSIRIISRIYTDTSDTKILKGADDMLISFLRTLILYLIVIFGIRIMGKRQLGQLQPSELVVTILISNIATLPIENSDVPLILGIIPILTLMSFEVILSTLTLKSLRLRKLVWGNPRILIRDGRIDQKEMAKLRSSIADLMEPLRSNGIFDLKEVELVVAETTGLLSIYKKSQYEPLNAKNANINLPNSPAPFLVINDRRVLSDGLKNCGMTPKELEKLLKKEGYRQEDIFLMTCTQDRTVYIVPMERN